jgi:RecQ-mediated genome instability protein 1
MDLVSQLRAAILAQSLPVPSVSFLNTLCTSRAQTPPLNSLVATAKARLLACDLTSSSIVDRDRDGVDCLPAGIDNPQTRELRLPRNVHVQVVDVENLSLSRWEQIEELEAIERGERTRGREVIRVVASEENGENVGTQTQTQARPAERAPGAGANATHRLVLQDRSGTRVFALELRRMPRIEVGKTFMGEKILLKAGTVVARGVVLLAPDTCVLLGGKIDAWHTAWAEGRLAMLKEKVGADRPMSS